MKKIFALITAALMIFSFSGCAKQNLSFNIEGATKVAVFSGSTGRSAEITDVEAVAYITDNINRLPFVKDKSSKNYDGFNYSLTWYDGDNKIIDRVIIMGESRISYDDHFYDIGDVGDSIDIEYIDALFDDLIK